MPYTFTGSYPLCYLFLMNRLKTAFILLILVVLAVIGYTLYDNIGLIVRKEARLDMINPKAEFALKAAHFVETKGAKKILEVFAEEAYSFRENNLAELKKPRAIFYGDEGRTVHFSGDRGIIDTETNDVTIEGNVVMDSQEGYHLETSYLEYSSEGMVVTTDKPVRIVTDVFEAKGLGMRTKVEEEVFFILNKVETVLYLSSKGGPFAKTDNGME